MSRRGGGGGGGGSCTSTASLARYIPRALRRGGKKQQQQRGQAYLMGGRRRAPDGYAASVELSASAGSTWPVASVVRVVLWSGVVEVYAGVVLACAVVTKLVLSATIWLQLDKYRRIVAHDVSAGYLHPVRTTNSSARAVYL